MSQDVRKTVVEGRKDFTEMSSEEVEIRAIGDATEDGPAPAPANADETEQDVEYHEKRELAVDERENVDPSKH